MSHKLSPEEQEIVETFALFDDPMDKYEHIIENANELEPLADIYKTDEFIVKGCQSKVWLRAYKEEDKIFFQADSNTVITKGIIALLVKVLSGNKPKVIINHPLSFIDKIDLKGHLSSQRSNGLTAMIQKMKAYAEFLSK
jgi:cysteine desulfuration protein SufE